MEVRRYDASGAEAAATALPGDPFDGTVNEDALHQVVRAVMAHARQGTATTKNRSAVRGGGRKPWRQKGTGRARQGTIRAPQWRGGGVVFGPSPRDYDLRVPRTLKRLAIRSALNARALGGDLAVIAPLELEEPRTRTIAELLETIGRGDDNVLILTDGHKRHVYLSARNLPRVEVRVWGEASAYDVLWSDVVLVESTALQETKATGEEEDR